jgi:hypothetical protein
MMLQRPALCFCFMHVPDHDPCCSCHVSTRSSRIQSCKGSSPPCVIRCACHAVLVRDAILVQEMFCNAAPVLCALVYVATGIVLLQHGTSQLSGTRDIVEASEPSHLQKALQDGVRFIVITDHLDFQSSPPVPGLALNKAMGAVTTTVAIQVHATCLHQGCTC